MNSTDQNQRRRLDMRRTSGSFLSMDGVFPDGLEAIQHSVKLELWVTPSEEYKSQTNVSSTSALVDLNTVNPNELDFEKMRRDCELLKELIENHPDAVQKMLTLLQDGKPSDVEEAERLGEEIGLTESAFYEQGGGLAWLIVPIVVGLVSKGCGGHLANGGKKKTTPTTNTWGTDEDAGVPPPDAGTPPPDAGDGQ